MRIIHFIVQQLTFMTKIVNVERCPLGEAAFKKNSGVTTVGSVFKMSQHGDLTYYLTIRKNIIV